MKKHSLLLAGLLAAAAFTFTSCGDDPTSCPVGYEGKNCDTEMREKFVGNWNADERDDQDVRYIYNATIAKGSSTNTVSIKNLSDGAFNERLVNGTVEGNTLKVSNQKPNGANSQFSVEGEATYSGEQISWKYYLVQDSTNLEIIYTGIWSK